MRKQRCIECGSVFSGAGLVCRVCLTNLEPSVIEVDMTEPEEPMGQLPHDLVCEMIGCTSTEPASYDENRNMLLCPRHQD